jgi:hypothetical protein
LSTGLGGVRPGGACRDPGGDYGSVVSGQGPSGLWARAVRLGWVRPLGAGQEVVGVSVLSFWNAARRASAHGQVFWMCSFARRAENASRPATWNRR